MQYFKPFERPKPHVCDFSDKQQYPLGTIAFCDECHQYWRLIDFEGYHTWNKISKRVGRRVLMENGHHPPTPEGTLTP